MKLYISEKVIERRRTLGFTQEDLAQRIGVSAQAISNWERGVGYPDVTLLPSLAAALGISTDELLGVGRLSDVEIFEEFRGKLIQYPTVMGSKRKCLNIAALTQIIF